MIKRKNGFTLAEVLITLAVIGIVAALTISGLIQNYKRKVTETRLSKFYSQMSVGITLSEIENGPVETWDWVQIVDEDDDTTNNIEYTQKVKDWYDKYLRKYLNVSQIEELNSGQMLVYFPDGAVLRLQSSFICDFIFYPYASLAKTGKGEQGKNVFAFRLLSPYDDPKLFGNTKFSPYINHFWDGTIEHLYSQERYGCGKETNMFCTKLIQLNNWKIPKDYPFKF